MMDKSLAEMLHAEAEATRRKIAAEASLTRGILLTVMSNVFVLLNKVMDGRGAGLTWWLVAAAIFIVLAIASLCVGVALGISPTENGARSVQDEDDSTNKI